MDDWYAHVTVATVVENDGRFLLVEEHGPQGLVLNQPAGHLDPHESLQEAAVRETLEETGWHVELEGLLGLAPYTAPSNGVTYHRTTFYATPVREEPDFDLDTGIVRALWLSLDEILEQSGRMRSPLVIAAIERYLGGKKIPLDTIYHS